MKLNLHIMNLLLCFFSFQASQAAPLNSREGCKSNSDCSPGYHCWHSSTAGVGICIANKPFYNETSVTYKCKGTGTVEAGVASGPYLPTQQGFKVTIPPGQDQSLAIGLFTGGSFTAYFHKIFDVSPMEQRRISIKEYDYNGKWINSYVREDGLVEFSTRWGNLNCDINVE